MKNFEYCEDLEKEEGYVKLKEGICTECKKPMKKVSGKTYRCDRCKTEVTYKC